MTEKYKIAIVGATSIRGKELNEALGESAFSTSEIVLFDDESQAGQLEAAGDEATVIQGIENDSFAHVDFAFFTGSEEMTRKHWKEALSGGASIVDLSSALEDIPGVLVRAPWLLDESTTSQPEAVNLSTPAIIPAHPVAVALALIMSRLRKAGDVRFASATVLEPASEYGRAAIDELHQQTVALLNFQSLPKEVYGTQVAFNMVSPTGNPNLIGKSEEHIRRHYRLLRTLPGDIGIQVLHAPVFHGAGISFAIEFDQPLLPERVEAALFGDHIEIVSGDAEPPDNLRTAGQNEVLAQVRSQGGTNEMTNRFWIWATLDNLKIASLNAVACAMELRRLRPKGKVQ